MNEINSGYIDERLLAIVYRPVIGDDKVNASVEEAYALVTIDTDPSSSGIAIGTRDMRNGERAVDASESSLSEQGRMRSSKIRSTRLTTHVILSPEGTSPVCTSDFVGASVGRLRATVKDFRLVVHGMAICKNCRGEQDTGNEGEIEEHDEWS